MGKHHVSVRFATQIGAVLVAIASLLGCGASSHEIVPIDNAQRAALAWVDNNQSRLCLEYSTAAGRNNALTTSGQVSYGELATKLSVDARSSIAQIYNVSDILQFGHASLYRLCEAARNGDIDKQTFAQAYDKLLQRMHDLLELQVDTRHTALVSKRLEWIRDRRNLISTIDSAQDRIRDLGRQLLDTVSDPSVREALAYRLETTDYYGFDDFTGPPDAPAAPAAPTAPPKVAEVDKAWSQLKADDRYAQYQNLVASIRKQRQEIFELERKIEGLDVAIEALYARPDTTAETESPPMPPPATSPPPAAPGQAPPVSSPSKIPVTPSLGAAPTAASR